jgi:hypothetical protein
MKTQHKEVIAKLIERASQGGLDALDNVAHIYGDTDDWEMLRVESQKKISEVLGIEVEVLDDANVEWHYNKKDALCIGWLDSNSTHWTFQLYDAVELDRSSDGSFNAYYWH